MLEVRWRSHLRCPQPRDRGKLSGGWYDGSVHPLYLRRREQWTGPLDRCERTPIIPLAWSYDALGRVTGKAQSVGGLTLSIGYGYSNGDLTADDDALGPDGDLHPTPITRSRASR